MKIRQQTSTGGTVPAGMEEYWVPSVWAWYAAAAIWVLAALFAPMTSWISLIVIAAVSAVAGGVTARFAPRTRRLRPVEIPRADTGTPEVDLLLQEGRTALLRLRQLEQQLGEPALSADLNRMIQAGEAIFRYVEEQPETADQLRRFMNYFLPTTLRLLERYQTMAESGVQGTAMEKTADQIRQVMGRVADGFQRQYEHLFSHEALDLSAEIAVLEGMLGREGLDRDEFSRKMNQ